MVDKLECKKITIEIDKNLYDFMVKECKFHNWTKKHFINLCILHKFLNNAR